MTSKTAAAWVPKTDHSTNGEPDHLRRNHLHVVCNGKIDEKAEEERRSLIKSMSKRNTPNAVANKWAPIKEKDSKQVLKEYAPRSSALKSLEMWEQRKSVELAKRSEEQKIIDARRAAQEEQRRAKRAELLQRYSLSSPPTEQKPVGVGNRITSVTNDPTPTTPSPPPTIKYTQRKITTDSPSPFEHRKTCPPVVLPRTQFSNRSTRSSSSSSSVITTTEKPQPLPSSSTSLQNNNEPTKKSLPSPKIEPKTLNKEQKPKIEELKPAEVEKSPPRVTTELYLDVKTPEKEQNATEPSSNRYSVIEDGDNSEFLTHLEEIEQHDFDISGLSPSGLAILRGSNSLKISKSHSPTSGRSRNSSGRSSVSDRLKKFESLDASATEESSVLNTPKWSIKERSPEP